MTGKDEKSTASEVERYHALYDRVCRASAAGVGRLFATQDPRVQFIRGLEDGRVTARVELNALTRLLTEHLGVDPEVWLRCLNEELEAELRRLEQDAGVAGVSEQEDPTEGVRP